MQYKHDICIVGLKCFDLLRRAEVPKYLGGIERVLVTLARGLASEGLKVAFVTYDEGQPDALEIDGITVYKSFVHDAGIRGLRFVHPRMTAIWSAMRRADAKAYLQMGAGVETAVTRMGAHWFMKKRRFIFCAASDSDCDASLPAFSSVREKKMYAWGMANADSIVSQTKKQADQLQAGFGLGSSVIPLPFEPDASIISQLQDSPAAGSANVLWVGRLVDTKRLELYMDAARALPDITFHVVGASNAKTDYAKGLLEQASQISNMVVHGKISDVTLMQLYKDASMLCCTSTLEGFPTTFLEAWSFNKPVVTTFDPDGVVQQHGLGVVCDQHGVVDAVSQLATDKELNERLGTSAYAFYASHYTVKAIAPKYIELVGR